LLYFAVIFQEGPHFVLLKGHAKYSKELTLASELQNPVVVAQSDYLSQQ